MRRLLASLALAATLAAAPAARAESPDSSMSRLCDAYWQGYLKANPTDATMNGDRRYDAFLEDASPAGIAAREAMLRDQRSQALAMKPESLSPGWRLNRSLLLESLEGALTRIQCHFEEWSVDPRGGPQVDYFNIASNTPLRTVSEGRDFVRRCRAMGPAVDQVVSNLQIGLKQGKAANAEQVTAVIEELDGTLKQPVEEWGLLEPVKEPHPDWSEAERSEVLAGTIAASRDILRPAFERYRTFLATRVTPAARPQDKAGISNIPGGMEAYQRLIRMHTSLDRTPDQLHLLGLEEVARVRKATCELGVKVLGTSDLKEIQNRLRTDPAMHFATAQEVEDKARATLARAKAAIPAWFGILPKAPCEVKVMGIYEAPHSTIAYYQDGASDGSRPGRFMINTYKPETRPRYEAEALAFHESIPGHHLQISIAQELTGLPEFRKNEGTTAFIEGWGLYCERLADEMGLYSSDLDRMGMLSYDAWRACRLVVDTGIHARGWSRQRAIDYMRENTLLAENNIVNEVDRYIASPAQALAYKCGQMELLRLKAEAREKLGARFKNADFHDAVLRNGAVTLGVLKDEVEAYIAKKSAGGN